MEPVDFVPPAGQTESDPRFPSGQWTGYFLQQPLPGRSWMELSLAFQNGRLEGEGRDWVGEFVMSGRYRLEDGTCTLWKQYVGRHQVVYSGYNEGKGIWGVWRIANAGQGGFHIWPTAAGEPSDSNLSEAVEMPSHEPEPVTIADGIGN